MSELHCRSSRLLRAFFSSFWWTYLLPYLLPDSSDLQNELSLVKNTNIHTYIPTHKRHIYESNCQGYHFFAVFSTTLFKVSGIPATFSKFFSRHQLFHEIEIKKSVEPEKWNLKHRQTNNYKNTHIQINIPILKHTHTDTHTRTSIHTDTNRPRRTDTQTDTYTQIDTHGHRY